MKWLPLMNKWYLHLLVSSLTKNCIYNPLCFSFRNLHVIPPPLDYDFTWCPLLLFHPPLLIVIVQSLMVPSFRTSA